MVNDILTGISKKLYELFGSEYEIYSETVEQNLQEPCFLIRNIKTQYNQIIGKRFYFNSRFDIIYFSDKENKNNDMQNICYELLDGLEYIELVNGDLIHGTKMESETIDDVLHFRVNYNLILKRENDIIDTMQDIQINTK